MMVGAQIILCVIAVGLGSFSAGWSLCSIIHATAQMRSLEYRNNHASNTNSNASNADS